MNRTIHILNGRTGFLAFGAMVLLGLSAFSLATHLTLGSQTGNEAHASLSEALLGEVRVMLGDRLYKQADIYFHCGLDYKIPDNRLSYGWVARFQRELEPGEHIHAEGDTQIREIMPWLELSMRVNPDDHARPHDEARRAQAPLRT